VNRSYLSWYIAGVSAFSVWQILKVVAPHHSGKSALFSVKSMAAGCAPYIGMAASADIAPLLVVGIFRWHHMTRFCCAHARASAGAHRYRIRHLRVTIRIIYAYAHKRAYMRQRARKRDASTAATRLNCHAASCTYALYAGALERSGGITARVLRHARLDQLNITSALRGSVGTHSICRLPHLRTLST